MTEIDLNKIKKQVRFLTFYATIISVVLILTIAFLLSGQEINIPYNSGY